MTDYPPLESNDATHEVVITIPEQEPRRFYVVAWNNYDAFISALRELFGDDRNQEMQPFIISVKRIER